MTCPATGQPCLNLVCRQNGCRAARLCPMTEGPCAPAKCPGRAVCAKIANSAEGIRLRQGRKDAADQAEAALNEALRAAADIARDIAASEPAVTTSAASADFKPLTVDDITRLSLAFIERHINVAQRAKMRRRTWDRLVATASRDATSLEKQEVGRLAMFGIEVKIDDTLAEGEARFYSRSGEVVHIVNIGAEANGRTENADQGAEDAEGSADPGAGRDTGPG